jgi:hypothetical protein
MAEVPRYPTQYRVCDPVFSWISMQAVTSVIETLGNPRNRVIGKSGDRKPGALTADKRGSGKNKNFTTDEHG